MQSPRLPNWVLLSQLVRAALPFLVPWLPITGFLAGCQLTLLHLPLPPCPESQPYRPPGTGHLASQKNKITSCEPQPLVYNYDTYWWSYDHVVRHTVIPNPHPTLLSQWDSAQTVSEPVDSHSTSLPDDACKKKLPSTSANTRSVSIHRDCSREISARSERSRGSARHNRYRQHNRRQPCTDLANSRPQGAELRLRDGRA